MKSATKKKGREEDELIFRGTVEPFYSSAHPVTPAEAYGFAGVVLSTVLFLFHLCLLFSTNPTEVQKEGQLTQTKSEREDDALVRCILFSKHYAKAIPLWMSLAVCMYVILVECLSRVKVLPLDDGRLFTYRGAASRASSSNALRRRARRRKAGEKEEGEEKETKRGGSGGGGFIGESVDVRAWNEALFRRRPS
ncbi:unnamed protein product [Bathycoccus prasinos]